MNSAILKRIHEVIERDIREEAESIFEKTKEDFVKELDSKKDQIIAGIAINIMETVSIRELGNILQIEVKTDKLK